MSLSSMNLRLERLEQTFRTGPEPPEAIFYRNGAEPGALSEERIPFGRGYALVLTGRPEDNPPPEMVKTYAGVNPDWI